MKRLGSTTRRAAKFLGRVLRNPRKLVNAYRLRYAPETMLSAKDRQGDTSLRLTHVAAFTDGNAGDTIQPTCVRDCFALNGLRAKWKLCHVHHPLDENRLRLANEGDAVVIGSGGLFLKDTIKTNAGWQWNCTVEQMRRIRVPLVIFAVGYNRFRGQEEFDGGFLDSLHLLLDKSVFFSVRNTGSQRAIRSYLEHEDLRGRIVFQPCTTTLLRRMYPALFDRELVGPQNFIALNCAFDRAESRFQGREAEILGGVADAMRRLSLHTPIRYASNAPSDEKMLPYLDKAGVPYVLDKLYEIPSEKVVEYYRRPALTLGMRGHAQMIPFGCGSPILSLISHDKLKWFLDDIDEPGWGVDMLDGDLADRIVSASEEILSNRDAVQSRIAHKAGRLWNITEQNFAALRSALSAAKR